MASDFGYVENIIEKRFGKRASFGEGARTLHRVGANPDIDADTTETIWETGGIETMPTGNTITTVVSSSVADTGTVRLVGHTLNGDVIARVEQDVTLTGTTEVTLPTPLYRIEIGFLTSPTPLAGDVTVTSPAGTHLTIRADQGQSRKCALTVPSDQFLALTLLDFGFAAASSNAEAVASLFVTDQGSSTRDTFVTQVGSGQLAIDPPALVLPGSDVRVDATASANNSAIAGVIIGAYALVI